MNMFMEMLGFSLKGTQPILFMTNGGYRNIHEVLGLHYKGDTDNRQIVVCTGELGWGADNECMALFKLIPIKPKLQLSTETPYKVDYHQYKLCSLSWRQSPAAQKWDGKEPFLGNYVVKRSLHWSLDITDKHFSL